MNSPQQEADPSQQAAGRPRRRKAKKDTLTRRTNKTPTGGAKKRHRYRPSRDPQIPEVHPTVDP